MNLHLTESCFAALRSADPLNGEADDEWDEVRRERREWSADDVLIWENQPDKWVGRSSEHGGGRESDTRAI